MDEVKVAPGVYATSDHALYVEEPKALVVADLHLGYEGALRQQGVSLPRFQKKHIMSRLGNLLDRYSPEKVVVDGDFKHEFSRNLNEEWKEVLDVLDYLGSKTEAVMVRGNHDNYLKTILNRKGLELHSSYPLGDYTVAHGHEPMGSSKPLILGHEHPALRLRDEVGAMVSLPCFVVSKEVIVLPAFSPLAYGSDVLRGPHLCPDLTAGTVERADLYGLDEKLGVLHFGKGKELKAG